MFPNSQWTELAHATLNGGGREAEELDDGIAATDETAERAFDKQWAQTVDGEMRCLSPPHDHFPGSAAVRERPGHTGGSRTPE